MAAEEEIQDEAAVRHQLLNLIDLHLVPAPIKEPAVVLVVEGIAGDSENPLLESCEFMSELVLVHRTIVRFVNVSFHAVKIRHEDAKEWQAGFLNLKLGPRSIMEEIAMAAMTNDDDDIIRTKDGLKRIRPILLPFLAQTGFV